jgi:hypothetical protein
MSEMSSMEFYNALLHVSPPCPADEKLRTGNARCRAVVGPTSHRMRKERGCAARHRIAIPIAGEHRAAARSFRLRPSDGRRSARGSDGHPALVCQRAATGRASLEAACRLRERSRGGGAGAAAPLLVLPAAHRSGAGG